MFQGILRFSPLPHLSKFQLPTLYSREARAIGLQELPSPLPVQPWQLRLQRPLLLC